MHTSRIERTRPTSYTADTNPQGPHMLVNRTYRRFTALCTLGVAASLGLVSACSDEFSNCRETHTCPKGGSGSGGAAGAADAAGAAPSDMGGTDPGSAGTDPGAAGGATNLAGSGAIEPGSRLGEGCDESGALACNGSAQKLTLLCKNGVWTERDVCGSDENCDETTGVCAPIVEVCADKRGGELYCAPGQELYRCGPDLVSTELVEECEGTCLAAAGSASCVPPGCGDGDLHADEACDDGNTVSGDGCSAACRVEPVQLVASTPFFQPSDAIDSWGVCALGSNGKIRCFKPGTADWTWVDVPLAAEEKAVAIAGGGALLLCALLDDGAVRCWGTNSEGELGLGNKAPRALGQASANVDLGPGALASSIATGSSHACAVVNDGKVKCWGRNYDGQLGVTTPAGNPLIGDEAGEMGASLVAVPASLAGLATSVVLGPYHSCAVRSDKTVRCWGAETSGDPSGAQFAQFSINNTHQCGILLSGDLKCWGSNGVGELGQDSMTHYDGVQATDAVYLGQGRKAKSVATTAGHTCAVLDDGSVKCWGYNNLGQLGAGHTSNLGDMAGEMAALKPVDLGPSRRAKQLALSEQTSCALLEDGQVTCWGKVNLPAPAVLGDGPNEMGDKLPIVPLTF
jgi:cysteine-rich repeat protein